MRASDRVWLCEKGHVDDYHYTAGGMPDGQQCCSRCGGLTEQISLDGLAQRATQPNPKDPVELREKFEARRRELLEMRRDWEARPGGKEPGRLDHTHGHRCDAVATFIAEELLPALNQTTSSPKDGIGAQFRDFERAVRTLFESQTVIDALAEHEAIQELYGHWEDFPAREANQRRRYAQLAKKPGVQESWKESARERIKTILATAFASPSTQPGVASTSSPKDGGGGNAGTASSSSGHVRSATPCGSFGETAGVASTSIWDRATDAAFACVTPYPPDKRSDQYKYMRQAIEGAAPVIEEMARQKLVASTSSTKDTEPEVRITAVIEAARRLEERAGKHANGEALSPYSREVRSTSRGEVQAAQYLRELLEQELPQPNQEDVDQGGSR